MALELGGKSPVIVDTDVDPVLVAVRLVRAKFLNAGQTRAFTVGLGLEAWGTDGGCLSLSDTGLGTP